MNDKLDPALTLALLSPPIFLIAIGLTLDFRLTNTRNFRIIKSSLQRSPYLDVTRKTWGEYSRISKLLIIFQLCGAMAMSKRSIRIGLLHEKDVAELPRNIRQVMILSAWLGWISFIWLIIAALVF